MDKDAIGKKFLITTDSWFYAPDGEQYKAVHGTLKGIHDSEQVLGIRTNDRSTNWYVEIGNMIIAGCQIHYVIQTRDFSRAPTTIEFQHKGKNVLSHGLSRIYDAD